MHRLVRYFAARLCDSGGWIAHSRGVRWVFFFLVFFFFISVLFVIEIPVSKQ